ncbi:hypothetical protein ACOME3_006868 [Neoechinorhynchus agilis]
MSKTITAIPILSNQWCKNDRLEILEDTEEYSEEERRTKSFIENRKVKDSWISDGLNASYSVPIGGFVRLGIKYGFKDCGQLEVSWIKNGIVIDDNFLAQHINVMILRTETQCALMIKRAQIEDSGDYEVRLRTLDGSQCSSNGHLEVTETGSIQNSEEEIRITKHLENIDVHVGMPLELYCEFKSKETPEIYWYLNDIPLESDPRFISQKEASRCFLSIKRFSKSDSGFYTVKIIDSTGFDKSQCSVKAVSSISKNVAPSFTKKLNEINAPNGQDVALMVDVNGNPDPMVSFFKNGEKIPDEKINRKGMTYRYIIRRVNQNDTGVYSVTAVNNAGEAKTYARVHVREEDERGRPGAPLFQKSFRDQNVFRGENVLFEAMVFGTPKPKVRWLLNDRPIRNSRYYYSNVNNKYSLTISNVCSMDSGLITLLVENKYGRATCSANLYVTDLDGDDIDYAISRRVHVRQPGKTVEQRRRMTGFDSSDAYESSDRRRYNGAFNASRSDQYRKSFRPVGYKLIRSSSDHSIKTENPLVGVFLL